MEQDLEKKIKYEKIENMAFKIGAYASTIMCGWGIGLSAALYNDNDYSNFQIANLFVNAIGVGLLGYVCSGVSKRGKVIVSKLEEELNRRK